jgi:hypothetical protein
MALLVAPLSGASQLNTAIANTLVGPIPPLQPPQLPRPACITHGTVCQSVRARAAPVYRPLLIPPTNNTCHCHPTWVQEHTQLG